MSKEQEVKQLGEAIGYALGIDTEGERLPFTMHTRGYLAKFLVEEGYRKLNEDDIVLTKEAQEGSSKDLDCTALGFFVKHNARVRKDVLEEVLEQLKSSSCKAMDVAIKRLEYLIERNIFHTEVSE